MKKTPAVFLFLFFTAFAPVSVFAMEAPPRSARGRVPSIIDETPAQTITIAPAPLGAGADTASTLRDGNSGDRRLVVGRHVDAPLVRDADWEKISSGDGRTVWRLALRSEGAFFLRPHFLASDTGEEIFVYGVAGKVLEVFGHDAFWGPPVNGDCLFVAASVDGEGPPSLRVDRLSHGTKDFFRRLKEQSCHLDVNCYGEWAQIKTAVGTMLYEDSVDGEVICTGSLLSDVPDTKRPWFLSANHCVDTQSEAQTLIVYWNFESEVCNGQAVDLESCPTSEGADFMTGSEVADFSLMLLREDPPGGTAYLEWTTDNLPLDEQVAVIHHPDGAYKRLSLGRMDGDWDDYWTVLYYEGSTEPGSSGAPLFNSRKQVVGQLSGGDASCYNMQGTDDYGMFGRAWEQGLSGYLSGGDIPTTTTTTVPPPGGSGGTKADDDEDGAKMCGC